MLSSIRNMLGSVVVLALMGLLIASFALWGIPDIFSTTAARAVAEVDDTEITDVEFSRRYEQRLREIQAQLGESFSRDQARQFGLPQQTLQQMVSRLTFDLHARRLGLRASPAQVIEELRAIPAFEGLTGGFDRQTYEQQLQRLGMTPGQFEDEVRRDIVRGQLFEALTNGSPVPDALARTLFRHRQEERRATILTVGTEIVGEVQQPGEDELRRAYELDQDRYMTPEYREVAVARISPTELAEPAEVSQAELETAYEERITEYRTPELRNLSIVTVPRDARERAEALAERVRAGEPFADVVTEMTDFTPEETQLGDLSREDLESDYSAQVAEAVFAAPEDSITEPVQSVFGWHVFRVEDITPAENRPLEEIADRLRREVATEKAMDTVYDISIEAEDALARGASVEEIARDLSLTYHRTAVTRDGLTEPGELAPEAVRQSLETIWSIQVEDPAVLEPTEDNGFVLVDVLGTIPPEPRPFEAVRDQIEQQLVRERRLAAAGDLANRTAERIRAGETPEVVAEDMGLSLTETGWVPRNPQRQQQTLAPGIQQMLFDLRAGEVGIERASAREGYIVARLEEIRPGQPERNPQDFAALKAELEQRLLNDALGQYERVLRSDFGVEVNEQRLTELVSPQQPTF